MEALDNSGNSGVLVLEDVHEVDTARTALRSYLGNHFLEVHVQPRRFWRQRNMMARVSAESVALHRGGAPTPVVLTVDEVDAYRDVLEWATKHYKKAPAGWTKEYRLALKKLSGL